MSDEKLDKDSEISILLAAFFLGNAAAGIGLINIAEVFHFGGGVIISTIVHTVRTIFKIMLTFVMIGLITWGMLTINLNSPSMQDILLRTSGKTFQIFGIVNIILYSFFVCVAYHVVIGDQIDRVLYNAVSPTFCQTWYYNRKFTIPLASTMFFLPFIFPKKIDLLRHLSLVGVIAVLYIVFMVILTFFVLDYEKGEVIWFPKELKFATVVPAFCNAYHSHIQSISVFWCLKEQTLKSVLFVCLLSTMGVFLIYSLVGTFGYLTFGSEIMSNILLNYEASNVFNVIALILVTFRVCCIYPLVLFYGRDAVIDMFLLATKQDPNSNEMIRRVVVALLWFILAISNALFFPDIGAVIDVLGIFVAFFMFLFPGICVLNQMTIEDKEDLGLSFLSYLLIAVGVVCAIVSLGISTFGIVQGYEGQKSLCTVV